MSFHSTEAPKPKPVVKEAPKVEAPVGRFKAAMNKLKKTAPKKEK